jgi:hypothetical protein
MLSNIMMKSCGYICAVQVPVVQGGSELKCDLTVMLILGCSAACCQKFFTIANTDTNMRCSYHEDVATTMHYKHLVPRSSICCIAALPSARAVPHCFEGYFTTRTLASERYL